MICYLLKETGSKCVLNRQFSPKSVPTKNVDCVLFPRQLEETKSWALSITMQKRSGDLERLLMK